MPSVYDKFKLVSDFELKGDQARAIPELVDGLNRGDLSQVLLGVTGSGKTFTMAKVIDAVNRPTLVMVHNKTLAAQLYQEFRRFFPENAVEYFVSYYDYYQPEAYVPSTDSYIEKEAIINDEIDRMRLSATRSLFERRDVIIVSSVSCIYGLGSPEAYYGMLLPLQLGQRIPRDQILRKLVEIQYERNESDFTRGTFRVRGDVIEVYPSYEEQALRIELFGDDVDALTTFDPLTGKSGRKHDKVAIYPKTHFVAPREQTRSAVDSIKAELVERRAQLESLGKVLEAQRLHQRTMFDLEMMKEIGYCHGIENYSRHLSGRAPGEPPPTLLDYLPDDALLVVDESHQTVPQIRGMYAGDRSRKTTLVEFGFRLPSALDNRPLTFAEWEARATQTVYVSATPGPYELAKAGGVVVEQIIRPTGLMDPPIEVRPVKGQIDDLLGEIRTRAAEGTRTLVTTLTKRMAEDLTTYYQELGVRVRYLHSEVETLERIQILRDLRLGEFDVLVGINLLREGLDLPEVSLVAILDADKEGFLRSAGSLIQTSGRAARNVQGRVIMYADTVTESMRVALEETSRRRVMQEAYNTAHDITPSSIIKAIDDISLTVYNLDYGTPAVMEDREAYLSPAELETRIEQLQAQMRQSAANLDFERAASLRDKIKALKSREMGLAGVRAPGADVLSLATNWLKSALLEVQEYVKLSWAAMRGAFSRPFYFHDVIEQLEAIGVGSLTVVLLTGLFTGAVLALQSGLTLDQFGARPIVGRLVSASMVKELGPVLTALMLAGRVGSGIAAELGSMVVTDQINALRALGTDPIRKLVVPRVIAGVLMAPILTIISDFMGILGGGIIAIQQLQVPSSVYWKSIIDGLYMQDVWMGIAKPFFLGFAIVSIGCHVGLAHEGGHAGSRARHDERSRGGIGHCARA